MNNFDFKKYFKNLTNFNESTHNKQTHVAERCFGCKISEKKQVKETANLPIDKLTV